MSTINTQGGAGIVHAGSLGYVMVLSHYQCVGIAL